MDRPAPYCTIPHGFASGIKTAPAMSLLVGWLLAWLLACLLACLFKRTFRIQEQSYPSVVSNGTSQQVRSYLEKGNLIVSIYYYYYYYYY
ncbi:hypothetical protein M0802_002235 [Mischocyttarus mexicanus]|nr:hypothetical protein M0802_002235 [Mischocyttarus mexicanus]